MPDIKARLATVAPPAASSAPVSKSMLGDVIRCLESRSPAVRASPTSPGRACGATVLDAAPGRDAVVLMDAKMSSCSINANARESDPRSYAFLHALAVPFARIAGVEDEKALPPGLWAYAWRVASAYMPASDVVLFVNGERYRSQDQFHIHLARLIPDARKEILHPSAGSDSVPPTYIDRLSGSPDPVWAAAQRNADELAAHLGRAPGLQSGLYGVRVIYDEQRRQYAVAAVDYAPEPDFVAQCPDGG